MSFKLDCLKMSVYFAFVLIRTIAIILFKLNMNISKNLMLSFESHEYYFEVSSDVRVDFLKHVQKK